MSALVFTPGRLRPSLLPDYFAGLPVLLSQAAVEHEFPGAEDRLGCEWAFEAEDVLLGPGAIQDRLIRPMETSLYPALHQWRAEFRPVAVTFEVAPPVVAILVWAVSRSPSTRRPAPLDAVPAGAPSRVHQQLFRSPTGRVTEVLTRSWS